MFFFQKRKAPLAGDSTFRKFQTFGKFALIANCLLLLLCACNVTRHLDTEKGERLLVKNSLHIKAEKRLKFSAKTALSYELEPYYRQKPNHRSFYFFYTRLWFHYKYHNRKSGFAKFVKKRVAEPPTIYNDSLAQRTALNFKNQMRQRGYFRAECRYSTFYEGKTKAKTDYHLVLGPRYTVENVQFASRDTQVLDILRATAGESLLERNTPLDARIFDAEKLRISSALKNRGYAYFIPQFVEFNADSTGTKANVTVEVLPFNDSTMHRKYTIGKVAVLSSVVPSLSTMRRDTLIGGIYFAAAEAKLWIRPSLLRKKILISPGELYNQSGFEKTNRNLNALGVYRFVALRPVQDSIEDNKINVTVNLSPNRRFSFGQDLDFNYSRSSFSSGLLGLSPNFSVQNRNMLSGAEHLQSTASYNVEFDIATTHLIFSQEFKIQNEVLFPRFFDYLGFWRFGNKVQLGKKHLVPNHFYERMRNDGEARLSLNYNYLDVTQFYSYHLLTATFGYNVRSHPEHQFNWDHVGVDVLRPRFDSLLVPGEFLRRSFANQLFTGLILRSFNYNHSGRANYFGEHWNYRLNSELSGLEELAINRLWSVASGKKEPPWRIGDLDFAQFFRLDQELVYTRNFTKEVAGAVRVGVGAAAFFGDTKAVPFVKQFFVGGPASIRAWRIRELGPGGYVPRGASNEPKPVEVQPFYQAADFRFEFGGELRFPLFLWFKGAVFLDGGNIWTLQKDLARPGSQLGLDSYKNVALGAGLGMRMDLDYFVLRLDFGLPLRRPYSAANGRGYWVPHLISRMQPKDFNPNLAVGFPF